MSYQLYKAIIHVMCDGNVVTRIAYSENRDDFGLFLAEQKRKNPSHRFAALSQEVWHHVPGKFHELVKQAKAKGSHGIWEDETKLVSVSLS